MIKQIIGIVTVLFLTMAVCSSKENQKLSHLLYALYKIPAVNMPRVEYTKNGHVRIYDEIGSLLGEPAWKTVPLRYYGNILPEDHSEDKENVFKYCIWHSKNKPLVLCIYQDNTICGPLSFNLTFYLFNNNKWIPADDSDNVMQIRTLVKTLESQDFYMVYGYDDENKINGQPSFFIQARKGDYEQGFVDYGEKTFFAFKDGVFSLTRIK